MMKRIYALILPVFIICIVALSGLNSNVATKYPIEKQLNQKANFYDLSSIKDTLFVLGNTYIELCLNQQVVRLYKRNDDTLEFKISTGCDRISKGIKTPTGLYAVHSKTPKAISRQFNNAELFWWIGFSGNIGFHGLAGNGYYQYLGLRPSSHGCVRISREDGSQLYSNVKLGTPVLVYDNEPARVLAFGSLNDFNPATDYIFNNRNAIDILRFNNRLASLYSGHFHYNYIKRIFLSEDVYIGFRGLDIGSKQNIAPQQKKPIKFDNLLSNFSDNTKVKRQILEPLTEEALAEEICEH